MHDVDLILTLAGGLSAALVFGAITHRLRLSPIVGYLIAGVVVGPHFPGFEADAELASGMAELGVVLLLFGVGLHFHLRELLEVRSIVVPGALVASAVATAIGTLLGRTIGWSWPAAAVFGGCVAVASTVVLLRVLADHRALHTRPGHVAVGWLVVEDLLTVAALVVLPTVFGGGEPTVEGLLLSLLLALVKIAALVAVVVFAGGKVIPRILEVVSDTGSRELFTLAVLVVALGIAVGAARVFGVSMALGAFLAGMMVGRSEFSLRAASEALPMRDAFAVLFFVSVGMLFDPSTLVRAPLAILATVLIVVLVKPAVALAVMRFRGVSPSIAVPVAAALAQIGEFSFILGNLGRDLGIVPAAALEILVAAAIVTITLNPLLYRLADRVAMSLARSRTGDDDPRADVGPAASTPSHRAIVVGYGPVGSTVTELLLDNSLDPTVIELNLETVRRLLAFGVRAIYGDASRPEVLERAGIARADNLILTSGSGRIDEEIIRHAKRLNPHVCVLARTHTTLEVPRLRRAGAEEAFSGEGEVALALTVRILEGLGASPEQIDRERERVEARFRGD
ncbi:MAG: sodium:proton exchanger [Planctomycetota bacterium]|nr:MAG: sodium:proton exchanger [Planctomycetota bacterium]